LSTVGLFGQAKGTHTLLGCWWLWGYKEQGNGQHEDYYHVGFK